MITPGVIFRDVWGLGPSSGGYPGSFPRGLIKKIRRRWWGKKRVWLFSGGFKDSEGVTVDIKPSVKPDIVADCEQLPIKSGCFDFVMLDPPYSEKEAMELYQLAYINLLRVMNEAARICAPEDRVILLHRLVPFHHPGQNSDWKRMIVKAIIGVYTIAGWTNMRALTVWEKHRTLEESIR